MIVRPLWCPWCGKRHVDLGEFATREHHTHLCVDDPFGLGCGGLWRLEVYVFGGDDTVSAEETSDR